MPAIQASPLSGTSTASGSTASGTATLSTNFKNQLFQFLEAKGIEGLIPYVYNDNKGIPTLGVGYAMVEKISGVWKVRPNYQKEFKAAARGDGVESCLLTF